MQAARVKKLILVITTTLATALLVIAFVAPATAKGAVRTVAPVLHLATAIFPASGTSNAQQASGTNGRSISPQTQANGNGGSASSNGTATADGLVANELASNADSHSISTSGHENCGRFGSGFHGGKHNFTCPNQPFPVKSHF